MAATIQAYAHTLSLLCGPADWAGDTVRLALVTNGYAFSAAHTAWAEASAHELASGGGYATGGRTLATGIDVGALAAADVTFPGLTATFRGAVAYIAGTVGGIENPVLFYIAFDAADTVVNNIDFTVAWNAVGVATLA